MKTSFFCFSLIVCASFSCNNKGKVETNDVPYNQNINQAHYVINDPERFRKTFTNELFELNNEAVLLTYGRNKEKCKSALLLLEEALAIDSAFFYAYVTKAHIYTILGDYTKAINLYKSVSDDIKVDDIELYSSIAKLYEKIGQIDKAKEYYQKAIGFYSHLFNEVGSIIYLVLRAHFKFILNPEEGMREIDSLIATYPTIWELELDRLHRFENYDHQKELDNL